MYTAKIVDAAPMIEGDDTESSIKMLEAYGVKREITAKSGVEALRKMARNWELSGFLE